MVVIVILVVGHVDGWQCGRGGRGGRGSGHWLGNGGCWRCRLIVVVNGEVDNRSSSVTKDPMRLCGDVLRCPKLTNAGRCMEVEREFGFCGVKAPPL